MFTIQPINFGQLLKISLQTNKCFFNIIPSTLVLYPETRLQNLILQVNNIPSTTLLCLDRDYGIQLFMSLQMNILFREYSSAEGCYNIKQQSELYPAHVCHLMHLCGHPPPHFNVSLDEVTDILDFLNICYSKWEIALLTVSSHSNFPTYYIQRQANPNQGQATQRNNGVIFNIYCQLRHLPTSLIGRTSTMLFCFHGQGSMHIYLCPYR